MPELTVEALVARIMMAADGALFGVSFACVAFLSFRKYSSTFSALRKIREAPYVQPSDLRSIVPEDNTSGTSLREDGDVSNSSSDGGRLVIVRGSVEAKSAAEKGNWKSLIGSNLVSSQESGESGVILQRTQTYVYRELRSLFGWNFDLRTLLLSRKELHSSSIRMIPFVLVEKGNLPESDYVVVNMEGSWQPLPLTTVYQHLQPIIASPRAFLQALCGLDYPIGLLYEEKILPPGKDITAVGICSIKNGIPEIRSCLELPYFLSNLTKDQMVADLSFKSKVLMWSGFVFGSIAIGILGYSISRSWIKWMQQRQQEQNDSTSNQTAQGAESAAFEELEDVPDGALCVICVMRRRRSAFIPCGHLVCCQSCALTVERESSPKCPVCRQSIRSSVRVYDS